MRLRIVIIILSKKFRNQAKVQFESRRKNRENVIYLSEHACKILSSKTKVSYVNECMFGVRKQTFEVSLLP